MRSPRRSSSITLPAIPGAAEDPTIRCHLCGVGYLAGQKHVRHRHARGVMDDAQSVGVVRCRYGRGRDPMDGRRQACEHELMDVTTAREKIELLDKIRIKLDQTGTCLCR